MKQESFRKSRIFGFLLIAVAFGLIILSFSLATPEGADFTFVSTGQAPNTTAENRSDEGGTITILTFDIISQDQKWKGYVGNITGKFSLRDANLFTLYDWTFAANDTLSGEIYAIRTNNPDWTDVSCANSTNILADETFLGINTSALDSIVNTFAYKAHDAFTVGSASGDNSIAESTCNSTATYINSTAQNMGGGVANIYFQEVLLQEGNDYVVYTALLEDDHDAYIDTANVTFDFQMIVPDPANSTSTTYYFYTEIDA